MNLYLLSQDSNGGYDTYDSCVVCAASEAAARLIHPQEQHAVDYKRGWDIYDWAKTPEQVTVVLLGVANAAIPAGVVCASFNAG